MPPTLPRTALLAAVLLAQGCEFRSAGHTDHRSDGGVIRNLPTDSGVARDAAIDGGVGRDAAADSGTEPPAPRASCTDGADCACDRLRDPGSPHFDPDLVFCEDFEDPVLDQNGSGTGWVDAYGSPINGCWVPTATAGMDWRRTVEGTCPSCCVNVVTNEDCDVASQSDCAFDGSRALGHRYRPGETGGIIGNAPLQTGQHFGVTMMVKFSRNFDNAPTPKKTNQFGGNGNCILGCSSGTYGSTTSGNPFHGVLFWNANAGPPVWTDVVGHGGYSGVAFGWHPEWGSGYDFDRDHGLDQWRCWKLHIANVAQEDAVVRHWIDERLVVHITDIDLRSMSDSSRGFDIISLNNYFNGGYTGDTVAYRYEDNIAITTGPEPVSCQAIGFN